MELHIAVVDDRKADRERLEQDIRLFFSERQEPSAAVRVFESGQALLDCFQAEAFDLVFLDIVMDGMDGIELARRLREADTKLLIVFLTSSREYAFDAFPVHPFDYLVKPYDQSALNALLTEALRVLSLSDPEVTVRVSRAAYQVPLRKLCSIVSNGHRLDIVTTDGHTLNSIMTFSELRSMLGDDPRFLECNRGVIVNMDQVLSLNGDTLKMKNGSSFPLRVRNRSEIVKQFSQYMISRMNEE